MSRRQRTVSGKAELDGVGLFTGRRARVSLLPGEPDSGIVFRRTDLPGEPEAPASVSSVAPGETRSTTLCRGEARVCVVEHLLSAAYGLGVDNLVVAMTGEEMPAGDGSALTYVKLIRDAGVVDQDAPAGVCRLRERVFIEHHGATVEAEPFEGGLRVTFTLDYGDRFVRTERLSLDITEETYVNEIAPARTYVLRPEIRRFLDQGLGRGASLENLLIVEENGDIEGDRRFEDECVRHKIVDILGDLALVGRRLNGHVKGRRAGHAVNVLLARRLADICAACR